MEINDHWSLQIWTEWDIFVQTSRIMKATFLERKLQTIELVAQLKNESLLTFIEQLLRRSEASDASVVEGYWEEEEREEEVIEIWRGLYKA